MKEITIIEGTTQTIEEKLERKIKWNQNVYIVEKK